MVRYGWLLHRHGGLEVAHAHPSRVASENVEELQAHRMRQHLEVPRQTGRLAARDAGADAWLTAPVTQFAIGDFEDAWHEVIVQSISNVVNISERKERLSGVPPLLDPLYSTVTLFARFRGWSTFVPRFTAM
jgi:hypothetical protein